MKFYQNMGIPIFKLILIMLYDLIILFCLLLFITTLLGFINHGIVPSGHNLWYRLFLLALIVSYYYYNWSYLGCTLGMRAWHAKICSLDKYNQQIKFSQCLLRLFLSVPVYLFFGLGFISKYFNKYQLSLLDKLSKTVIIINK